MRGAVQRLITSDIQVYPVDEFKMSSGGGLENETTHVLPADASPPTGIEITPTLADCHLPAMIHPCRIRPLAISAR